MDSREDKYIGLILRLIALVLGFLLVLVLLFLLMRGIFGLLKYVPWLTYVYMSGIILLPFCLFTGIYLVYWRRTKKHPAAVVKYMSYGIFAAALAGWAYCLYADVSAFFKHGYTSIDKYASYNMFFLAGNVFAIFLVGIIQALTTEKEKDWLQREP